MDHNTRLGMSVDCPKCGNPIAITCGTDWVHAERINAAMDKARYEGKMQARRELAAAR